MEIRNSLDAVRSLLGVKGATSAMPTANQNKTTTAAAPGIGADQATLSNAGSEVSLATSDTDIRTVKVASIQAALATGSYHVPASAVASKVIDSMLGKGN